MMKPQRDKPRELSLRKRLLCWLIFWLCNLLRLTYRISYHNSKFREDAIRLHPKGSYNLALWHEHALTTICGHTHMGIMPMVSLSEDGEFITYLLKRLGFHTPARGSSSRGGREARDVLMSAAADGIATALTVDGPRGPRHIVKSGVIAISRDTGVAIVPVVGFANRYWEFRSWDRFKLPKPWAKICIVYGPPLVVDKSTQGAAFGEAKRGLTEALFEIETTARTLCGVMSSSIPSKQQGL